MKVVGRHIYDDNGNKFQIFGININGFELAGHGYCLGGMWANNTMEEIASNIRLAGWNTVRIPVHPKIFDNNPVPDGILGVWQGSDNEKLRGIRSLDALDRFINCLRDEGIYFIIDHHYLEPGSGFPGDIPPFWYTNNYQEATWIKDLVRLVERYRNQPHYIGIDIKNEPGKGCSWGDGNNLTDWKQAVNKAFYAIEKVDKKGLIIVEPFDLTSINLMHQDPPDIPKERLLLSKHEYSTDIWPWIKGQDDPQFPRNQRPVFDEHFGNVARARAVYIGEMGGQYGRGASGIKDKLHQDELIAYLTDNDIINITPWAYGENGGMGPNETGGFTDGGYIKYRRDKLDALKPLRTEHAFYFGEEPKPGTKPVEPSIPEKPVEPTLPEEPSVSVSFNIGEILEHKTGEGPKVLYIGEGIGEYLDPQGTPCRLMVDDKRYVSIFL